MEMETITDDQIAAMSIDELRAKYAEIRSHLGDVESDLTAEQRYIDSLRALLSTIKATALNRAAVQ